MNGNEFTLCPMCGGKNISYINNRKWFCSDCGFDLYNNVAAAVGVVIADSSGSILLERRAKDPRKGFLAFPGGFVDQDESAEHAAQRECFEETGIKPAEVAYLCSFPNTYLYRDITYKTCDMFFTAELPPGIGSISALIEKLHGQQTEVLGFESVHIASEQDIAAAPLAFDSARKTLSCWLMRRVHQ